MVFGSLKKSQNPKEVKSCSSRPGGKRAKVSAKGQSRQLTGGCTQREKASRTGALRGGSCQKRVLIESGNPRALMAKPWSISQFHEGLGESLNHLLGVNRRRSDEPTRVAAPTASKKAQGHLASRKTMRHPAEDTNKKKRTWT